MNSPVTLSSLEGADNLMRQVYQMQTGAQAR
jgi:hypothetical protein